MKSYKELFATFDKNIWLNAASEGPLPLCARDALYEVIEKKMRPHQLTFEYFAQVPLLLKKSIGSLINVNYRDVIIANSASYGIHLLANGMVWNKGDEIVLMENDFPSDILPWLALENLGVVVKQVKTKEPVISLDELKKAINSKTRAVCLTHVHTFSGQILNDIPYISELCHSVGAKFILNISQSCGNRPVDVSAMGVDGVVCAGYKWLVGPYGTGFCWMTQELRDSLKLNQAYWVSKMSEEELKGKGQLIHKEINSARKYDVFATSNFFNVVPFTSSIDMLLSIGLSNVEIYLDHLAEIFISGLDKTKYLFISKVEKNDRSALIVISHKDHNNNARLHSELTQAGLHTAFWKNNIRIAPHIFNTEEDIQLLLDKLNGFNG